MGVIDFNKVVSYSKKWCYQESHHLCATYVKNAFAAGGCTYISGDGWYNQPWLEKNDFKCIGDFVPIGGTPRAHDGMSIQFPEGYVQQIGDVCIMLHGEMGHICYAMGPGINEWVSDYFQKPPYQQDGTGPYCYSDRKYERVQFWRHSSVLNDTPVLSDYVLQQDCVYRTGSSGSRRSISDNWTYTKVEAKTVNSSDIMSNKKSTKTGIILGSHMKQK